MWYLKEIPKIAYFYWGNKSLSFLRFLTIYSFRKVNPDWEIRLYRPKELYHGEKTWTSRERYNICKGHNYLHHVEEIADKVVEIDFDILGFYNNVPETYKADFLRWKLLSAEGGLWSDFDIIYYRPMSGLYFNNPSNKEIDTIICERGFHRIGFLLSSANNQFYNYISDRSTKCFNKTNYQSIGSSIFNSSFPGINSVKSSFPGIRPFNMQMIVVYPVGEDSISEIFNNNNQNLLTNNSIGIHWFGGHPQSKVWEDTLTEENYNIYNSTICHLIANIIGE